MASFFDDPDFFSNNNYELCKKVRQNHEVNLDKEVIIEGELSLRPNPNLITTKYFKIMDNKLIYFSHNDHELPKGYYDLLTFLRLKYEEIYVHENKNMIYVFKLEKFGKMHEFFLKDRKLVGLWVKVLRQYCVCNDYSQIYIDPAQIGKGHFAAVYKVKHWEENKHYAAKIFEKNQKFIDQKFYLFNEIKILKTLKNNEHIIKLYEIYESPNNIILIFELIDDGDLYQLIKKNKGNPLSEQKISLILINMLKAIRFLHLNGYTHRDIKPENILLGDLKNLKISKLADFSLVESFISKKLNTKCGTPGYMAPEILEGEIYDQNVDIFSLGVTLYMMFCGKSPFKGKDAKEVLLKNKICVIKYRKIDWAKVSHDARKLVKRMLCKNPKERIKLNEILSNKWVKEQFQYHKMEENIEKKYEESLLATSSSNFSNINLNSKLNSNKISEGGLILSNTVNSINSLNPVNSMFLCTMLSNSNSPLLKSRTNSKMDHSESEMSSVLSFKKHRSQSKLKEESKDINKKSTSFDSHEKTIDISSIHIFIESNPVKKLMESLHAMSPIKKKSKNF